MATVAAGPVFRLLGAKDLGVRDDYTTAKMPPVNTGLLDGQLAWRQHDGGHTDGPNWKYFIAWADKNRSRHHGAAEGHGRRDGRTGRRISRAAHRRQLARSRTSSCSRRRSRAGSTSTSKATRSRAAGARRTIRSCWRTGTQNFYGWNAGDFGWGADRTENILWRLENGELDGVNPKVIVLLAGTNNVGRRARATTRRWPTSRAASSAIVRASAAKRRRTRRSSSPAIFPRNDNTAVRAGDRRASTRTSRRMADGKTIRYLERERQARRQGRHAVRRHDERARQAAPDAEGLSGLGRRAEADPHGAARPARRRPITRRRRPAIRARSPDPRRPASPTNVAALGAASSVRHGSRLEAGPVVRAKFMLTPIGPSRLALPLGTLAARTLVAGRPSNFARRVRSGYFTG